MHTINVNSRFVMDSLIVFLIRNNNEYQFTVLFCSSLRFVLNLCFSCSSQKSGPDFETGLSR